MLGMLRITEAASMALHAAALMAREPAKTYTTHEIAATLNVSEAHLSKVLQRLTRGGLVRPVRGRKGGFLLARPPTGIRLIELYEAIEGPLPLADCLLAASVCGGKDCILGNLLTQLNKQIRDYLDTTRLEDLALVRAGRAQPQTVR